LFLKFARISRDAAAGRGSVAPITLCTGRPQPYVEPLLKILDIRAPAICENGSVLYSLHDNRSVYGPGVTQEKVLGLRAVRKFLETDIMPAYPEIVYQFGKEAHMSVYCERPEVFDVITPRIAEFVKTSGLPEVTITPSHYYLNFSMAGVDKGKTLHFLLKQLGVTGAACAGIGDTEGDLPLREAVGFFACPSNAKPALQEVADYVSPYPDIAGMLDILRRPELQRA
jgi:HAD superfamily hydrolase (TIGR01484 family)